MIYGQRGGQQTGPVWGIAMSAAMGNGIVPRPSEDFPARATTRWPWSRTHDEHETTVAPRRA